MLGQHTWFGERCGKQIEKRLVPRQCRTCLPARPRPAPSENGPTTGAACEYLAYFHEPPGAVKG
eukprot:3072313-Prymnesium_polylepis.1